jgi:hypothetical protein
MNGGPVVWRAPRQATSDRGCACIRHTRIVDRGYGATRNSSYRLVTGLMAWWHTPPLHQKRSASPSTATSTLPTTTRPLVLRVYTRLYYCCRTGASPPLVRHPPALPSSTSSTYVPRLLSSLCRLPCNLKRGYVTDAYCTYHMTRCC